MEIPTTKDILRRIENSGLKGSKQPLISALSFSHIWIHELGTDKCLQRAASLTYTTILAIFPLIAVIALFVPVLFGGVGKIEGEAINFLGKILVPNAGDEMQAEIKKYFDIFKQNSAAVGIFGILGIMLSAVALLSNIEKAFNEIWRVYATRAWMRVFSNFTTILVCVPILIGGSIMLSSQLNKIINIAGELTALLVPYVITCMAFTLAFYILPNTRVKFKYAIISGTVAGLLWEAAKMAFRYYVANPNIAILVKSLGAIPIFLIWIYFSWFIVLLGCEMAYVTQNYAGLYREYFKIEKYRVMDSKLIFVIFMIIAENFQQNKGGIHFSDILKKITVRVEELKHAIDSIKKSGLIEETDKGKFIPARPLENIKVQEVLTLGCDPNELFFKEEEIGSVTGDLSVKIQDFFMTWNSDKFIRDFFKGK